MPAGYFGLPLRLCKRYNWKPLYERVSKCARCATNEAHSQELAHKQLEKGEGGCVLEDFGVVHLDGDAAVGKLEVGARLRVVGFVVLHAVGVFLRRWSAGVHADMERYGQGMGYS